MNIFLSQDCFSFHANWKRGVGNYLFAGNDICDLLSKKVDDMAFFAEKELTHLSVGAMRIAVKGGDSNITSSSENLFQIISDIIRRLCEK